MAKMKIDTKVLKTDGINAVATMGGVMLGNAASKLIPIENPLIKNAIPFAAGTGLVVLGNAANKGWVKGLGTGLFAFGALAVLNNVLSGPGMPKSGDESLNGFLDNPLVAKIKNALIPNLGNTDENFVSYSDKEFYNDINSGNMVEEIDYEEAVNVAGLDDEGQVFLNGIDDNGQVFLNGYEQFQTNPFENQY